MVIIIPQILILNLLMAPGIGNMSEIIMRVPDGMMIQTGRVTYQRQFDQQLTEILGKVIDGPVISFGIITGHRNGWIKILSQVNGQSQGIVWEMKLTPLILVIIRCLRLGVALVLM